MIRSVNNTNVWVAGINWDRGVTIHAIPEDPDDNEFLACAVEGRVDYLASEDHDLRRLGEYASIAILRKHEFLRLLEKRSEVSRTAEDQDDA